MPVSSKWIRRTGYKLRAAHSKTEDEPGLYIEYIFGIRKDRIGPIQPRDVVELRDWLNIYIKERITKDKNPAIGEMIAATRSVEKGLRKLDGK